MQITNMGELLSLSIYEKTVEYAHCDGLEAGGEGSLAEEKVVSIPD